MNCIEVTNVSKKFSNVKVLENVNLRLEENKIYGLLGRNGAGKTTLLNIITGRIFADSGTVLLDGYPILENDMLLHKIFHVGENMLYPENLTIKEIFKWTKLFYSEFDEAYASKIARQFELDMTKHVEDLSTGINSIIKIVIALSVNTPYILLDEPVLGLDAKNRDMFYRLLIEKYSENPSTIIISTNLIEEVSNVFEEIIVIKNGGVIVNEPREDLLSKGYTAIGPAEKIDKYTDGKNVIGTDSLGGLKIAHILGNVDIAVQKGIEISKLNLQKLFIQLTNS